MPDTARLLRGWLRQPTHPACRTLGDGWLDSLRAPVLAVPSAIVSTELNYLINPRHPEARLIPIIPGPPPTIPPLSGWTASRCPPSPCPAFHSGWIPAGPSGLVFTMRGEQMSARWSLRAANATEQRDSAEANDLGMLESLIWRALSGLKQREVTAELTGTLRSPRFNLHSNIDEAITQRGSSPAGDAPQVAIRPGWNTGYHLASLCLTLPPSIPIW